jgi:hypothetical protein
MFKFYFERVLVGRSALEGGDPPMGIAHGRLEPTEDYTRFRKLMKPMFDGAGKPVADAKVLSALEARTPDDREIICSSVTIEEWIGLEDPYYLEVMCWGVENPPYAELFPEHEKAYPDQFKG